jgi:hypothetical protein
MREKPFNSLQEVAGNDDVSLDYWTAFGVARQPRELCPHARKLQDIERN